MNGGTGSVEGDLLKQFGCNSLIGVNLSSPPTEWWFWTKSRISFCSLASYSLLEQWVSAHNYSTFASTPWTGLPASLSLPGRSTLPRQGAFHLCLSCWEVSHSLRPCWDCSVITLSRSSLMKIAPEDHVQLDVACSVSRL